MTCPYCQSEVKFYKDSILVYGRDYGALYVCSRYPRCDAYVGVHRGTTKPKGRLANKELREWKKKAHAAFDPIWQRGRMRRGRAYELLAEKLGIPKKEDHIGMFDVAMCKRTVEIFLLRKH